MSDDSNVSTVFQSDSFDVYRKSHAVRGREQVFHYVSRVSVSLVIPITYAGDAVMIEQYRAAISGNILEFPAGKSESGEDSMGAATREVREEAGFAVDSLTKIGEVATAPHFSNEVVHVFLARGSLKSGQSLTKREQISVRVIRLGNVFETIISGQPFDAKSLAAWMLYVRFAGEGING